LLAHARFFFRCAFSVFPCASCLHPAPCSSCGATCRYTSASITGGPARTLVDGTSRMGRNDAPTSRSAGV
jgi:hypothetical protein